MIGTAGIKTVAAPGLASGTEEFTVAVRCTVPETELSTQFFPRNNAIATTMTALYLRAALSYADVRCRLVCGALNFNESVYLIVVQSSLTQALDALTLALEDAGLLPLCRIAWWDAREGVYRTYYPKGEPFPNIDLDKLAEDARRIEAGIKAAMGPSNLAYRQPSSPGVTSSGQFAQMKLQRGSVVLQRLPEGKRQKAGLIFKLWSTWGAGRDSGKRGILSILRDRVLQVGRYFLRSNKP